MFQKIKFSSTDNIDEIVDLSMDEGSKSEGCNEKIQEKKKIPKPEESKSDTNTVNSKEFREYLKRKGLTLFPTKPKDVNTDRVDYTKPDKVTLGQNDKKKTVFRRLSNIFSKSKTSPKQNEAKTRLSFSEKGENNRSLPEKRVVISRSKYQTSDNGPILANNEFLTSRNFLIDSKMREKSDDSDDKRSSISSVLTAAADEDSVIETPNVRRRTNPSIYRNIDFNRSKLFNEAAKSKFNSTVPLVQPTFVNSSQAVHRDPRSSLRKSSDYAFQPVKIIPHDRHLPASPPPFKEINRNFLQKPRESNGTATFNGRSSIDPFTFAKIHEIKRKTDRVFQNEKSQYNNSNFIRNSNIRSSDSFPNANVKRLENLHPTSNLPQPQRSQSVLDNMTCYQNSLYGEVTYRQPNGSSMNVIMRRPSPSTLDRKQIMDKIYDYYRKSVNNTPVSLQENSNIYQKSHSINNRSLNDTPTYWQQNFRSSIDRNNRQMKPVENFNHVSVRKPKLSESDSEFPSESISSMDNYPRYSKASYATSSSTQPANDAARIYDVVHPSPRESLYGYIQRQHAAQRSSTPRSTSLRQSVPIVSRTTPNLPQSPSLLPNEMDIIYNNKIYRPIATIQATRLPQPETSQHHKDLRTPTNYRPESFGYRRPLPNQRRGKI